MAELIESPEIPGQLVSHPSLPWQRSGSKPRETTGNRSAAEIVARWAQVNAKGPILLNSDGNPWNKDAINSAFCRLEKKIGTKYHLGAFREGFATEALKAGVDTVTVAHLTGHRDPSMVSRVYGQVQHDPAHMANAAYRACGVFIPSRGR